VFDIKRCAGGGQPKLITPIEEPVVIVRILTHLNLPVREPPRAVARELSVNHEPCPESMTSVLWRIRRTCTGALRVTAGLLH